MLINCDALLLKKSKAINPEEEVHFYFILCQPSTNDYLITDVQRRSIVATIWLIIK
jgi:hypothetical protein